MKRILLLMLWIIITATSCASIHPTAENGSTILSSTKWVTTAVYKQVNGEFDKSVNYLNDPVAQGTVSSAQYSLDRFVFVPVDTKTGKFDLSNISALVKNNGKYDLPYDTNGKLTRRLYDTALGYTNSRVIVRLNPDEFSYIFNKDGENFLVEHRPFAKIYPGVAYPSELHDAISKLFQNNN
jgi:hypothetical protein